MFQPSVISSLATMASFVSLVKCLNVASTVIIALAILVMYIHRGTVLKKVCPIVAPFFTSGLDPFYSCNRVQDECLNDKASPSSNEF